MLLILYSSMLPGAVSIVTPVHTHTSSVPNNCTAEAHTTHNLSERQHTNPSPNHCPYPVSDGVTRN